MYSIPVMAREPRTANSVAVANGETIGQRIARLRNERGLTQKQLGEKIGIVQVLVSDYEKGKLRLHAENGRSVRSGPGGENGRTARSDEGDASERPCEA